MRQSVNERVASIAHASTAHASTAHASIAQARAWFAQELHATGPVETEAVLRAFRGVPRDPFPRREPHAAAGAAA